jgi:hypothetical protein
MNMDYGHEKFLDQLVNQKGFVTKALERLQRRTAEVGHIRYRSISRIMLIFDLRFCTRTSNGSSGYENAKMKRKQIVKRSRKK